MTKPRANWPEIKARYMAGEKPYDIAKDYSCTLKTIHEKISKSGWKKERDSITQALVESTVERRNRITEKGLREMEEALDAVYEHRRQGLIGVTVQDGEGFPNKLVEIAYKKALDVAAGSEQSITLSGGYQPIPVSINGKPSNGRAAD